MSQFPSGYFDPYAQPPVKPKFHPMSITSLVLTLIGIVPCCGMVTVPLGVIFGAIAIPLIGSNPMRRGKGMAVVSIILGVLLGLYQFGIGSWAYTTFGKPIVEGPQTALKAGFAGDLAGFKSHFHGAAAAATDAEAQAFIDELRKRYGNFVSSDIHRTQPQGQRSQTETDIRYVLFFSNRPADADLTFAIADNNTGAFIMKPNAITIFDSTNGNLTFPPSASSP